MEQNKISGYKFIWRNFITPYFILAITSAPEFVILVKCNLVHFPSAMTFSTIQGMLRFISLLSISIKCFINRLFRISMVSSFLVFFHRADPLNNSNFSNTFNYYPDRSIFYLSNQWKNLTRMHFSLPRP